MTHWMKIKSISRTSAVVGATWGVLIASVTMGLQLPLMEVITGLRNRALDYSALPEAINPLSDEFIERVLGPGASDARLSGLGPATRTVAGVIGEERKVVKHLSTNDDPSTAYAVGSIPFTAQTDVSSATRNGDPDACSTSGNTVWYRYKPTSDLGLIAYTFGTKHAVDLAAFEHVDGVWSQILGACHHGEYGNALIQFPAKAGTVYYFQVGSPQGGGDLRFSLDPRGKTHLVSASNTGKPADIHAYLHNTSPDGTLVLFESDSPGLVDRDVSCLNSLEKFPYSLSPIFYGGKDRYECTQVYLRDVISGRTTLVSATEDGKPGDSTSIQGFLSGNKRFVAFVSMAWNLTPNNPDGFDLYVKDMQTGAVEMIASSSPFVSTDPSTKIATTPAEHAVQNVQALTGHWWPSLSDDARFVAFQSIQAHVPEDTNKGWDVYVFDQLTRSLERASVSSSEKESEQVVLSDWSTQSVPGSVAGVDLTPFISATGRYVVFRSPAANLVEHDSNRTWDTFVRDRLLGTTERVSVNSRGEQGDGRSKGRGAQRGSSISADGRYVVFDSLATNLDGDRREGEWVYLRDRMLGTTRRIGLLSAYAVEGSGPVINNVIRNRGEPIPFARTPSISRNGRFITYTAPIRPLCPPTEGRGRPGGWNFCEGDIFVYDMLTDTTFPVTQLDAYAGMESVVSEDGRFVAFQSDIEGSDALQVMVYEAARAR